MIKRVLQSKAHSDAGYNYNGTVLEDTKKLLSDQDLEQISAGGNNGIGYIISSIFKFKQHKDNPTQVPLN